MSEQYDEGFLLSDTTPDNFTGKRKDSDGDKFWYKNGRVHRKGGPAAEWKDGGRWWLVRGQHHREDGPAREYADGRVEWWYRGVRGLENFPPKIKKKLTREFIHGT